MLYGLFEDVLELLREVSVMMVNIDVWRELWDFVDCVFDGFNCVWICQMIGLTQWFW